MNSFYLKMKDLVLQPRYLASEMIQFHQLNPRSTNFDEFEKIYPLPLLEMSRKKDEKIRRMRFGYSDDNVRQINILMVGTTGSGKSHSVNALINYLTDVKFLADYRLEIVNLEESEQENKDNQAESQTDWITVYEIGASANKLNCQINIVDTPGIADTKGKCRDEETFKKLKHLFDNYLTAVNAVCITMNGTFPRLTEEQRYVFDSILKIFGKDITKNIFIWATFTRDESPPVLVGIRSYGIRFNDYFSFENGPLYRKVPSDDAKKMRAQDEFNDSYKTFDNFFEKVKRTQSQSLENSKKVLEKRTYLKEAQITMEQEIKKKVDFLKAYKTYESIVEDSQENVLNSKDKFFEVTVTERCKEKVFSCMSCNQTCCDNCDHGIFKQGAYNCEKLTWRNVCKICQCKSNKHEHSTYQKFVTSMKSVFEIESLRKHSPHCLVLKDQNAIIEQAIEYLRNVQYKKDEKVRELESLRKKINELEDKILQLLGDLHKSIKKLKSLSLYEDSISVVQILNEIRSGEKRETDPDVVEIYQKLVFHASQLN